MLEIQSTQQPPAIVHLLIFIILTPAIKPIAQQIKLKYD